MPPTIDWNVLKPAMQNRRCVLFLGPDAYPFNERETVETALWNNVATNSPLVRHFYKDAGLVLFHKNSNRGMFREQVQQFFDDKARDWALTRLQLQKIVHLPFLAVVNFTIDDLLTRHYREAGFEPNAVHYMFKPSLSETAISEFKVDPSRPFVLNLLGSIRSNDNLVLTHNDLFDFLRALFDDKDIWLQDLLHEADCFLFIGVPFEKWYMQLLLQKLSKYQKDPKDAERYALPDQRNSSLEDLFQHYLSIQFVENSSQEVIDELYRFCEERAVLNTPAVPQRTYRTELLNRIYRLLLRGEIGPSITGLTEFAQQSQPAHRELQDGLVLVSAQYEYLQQNLETMNHEQKTIDRNKIIKSLLFWLEQADNVNPA